MVNGRGSIYYLICVLNIYMDRLKIEYIFIYLDIFYKWVFWKISGGGNKLWWLFLEVYSRIVKIKTIFVKREKYMKCYSEFS